MFSEKMRLYKGRTVFVLIITSFLLIIFTNAALALDDLPQLFFQNSSTEISDPIVVYLLNFREVSRASAQYFSFSAYFTGFDDSTPGWTYSGDEDLLELVDIMGIDNSLSMERYYSLLNRQDSYVSWLVASSDEPARIRVEERHIAKEELEPLQGNLLDISLIPREISPESGEIFTTVGFSFQKGAVLNQREGRVETGLWLNNRRLENIAVVSRRTRTGEGEEESYYIVQLAAALVSASEYAELNGPLFALGDIGAINKLLDKDSLHKRPARRKVTLEWAQQGPGLEFRQDKENFNYIAKLKVLSGLDKELDYFFNFNYYLHAYEDLALSLQLANEIGKKPGKQDLPIFRLGFADSLNWTDNFSIGLSYYPLVISKGEENTALWQLSCFYRKDLWSLGYRGELAGQDALQELRLSYFLDQDKEGAIIIGVDYVQEPVFSLAYSFNL
ncbi:MAG TPA: hypothetical protein PKM10_09565 [Halanaerobiales bacterium]|nr:hypothetical protein [Halanaerobiales bacterium]HPZ62909.1 hypothetical protein [Halanaerobiales bacterium]HQD04092.1 hypothetical protein [Halanaerobiales bacterium]